jgi:hypothetical protein
MMKQMLLQNWHFMRWLRLGLGIFIGIQAIQMHHPISGFIAAFFIFQSLTNTGCCGSSCNTNYVKTTNANKIEEIEYEEVK